MTRIRTFIAAALCVVPLVVVAAGCGSGSSSGAKSPLDEALGYLPNSAPFVLTLDTDTSGSQWKSLVANIKKFPFSGQITQSLNSQLQKDGFDFNKDIKPILGNQFVVGAPTAQALLQNNTQVIGAIEVKDKGKLEDAIKKSKDVHKDGSANGATLYKSSGNTELAVKGNVLVVADTKQQLTAALQQRDRNDRLTEDTFNSKMSGLPSDALVRLYVDAGGLLNASPAAAQAKQVKWVGALTTVGLTASSQTSGISLDFNAKTDSSKLTDADLPFASGDASPPVSAGAGEIGLGIRGLDQTIRFGESIAQIVSPTSYARFVKQKQQIGKALGIDVDKDLIGQLSGNTSESYDIRGHYAVRIEPKDPAAFSQTLAKFARVAPAFAQGAGLKGAKLTKVHGLYKLTGKSGRTIYYGMVGKVFAASDSAARLAQIASQAPQQVQGAKGSVALTADAGKLVSQIIQRAAGGGLGGAFGGAVFTAPLGNLNGWINSSTSGLTGHFELGIK